MNESDLKAMMLRAPRRAFTPPEERPRAGTAVSAGLLVLLILAALLLPRTKPRVPRAELVAYRERAAEVFMERVKEAR